MADSKITDFSAATSVNSADVLYLVQSSTDKKLTISTLLANLPATLAKFSGVVAIGGTAQSVVNTGNVNTTATITYVTNTANSALTLAVGSYEGQLKVIICTSASGTSTLTGSLGATSIEFSEPGHTALLLFSSSQNKWYFIGGTATVNM